MADNDSNHRSISPIASVEAGSTSPAPSRMTPPASTTSSKQQKQRTGSTSDTNGGPKVTKRRAARACVSCRARKVRCDVVEGAPCGNCRWDNVECVVQESRRRKKNLYTAPLAAAGHLPGTEALRASISSNPVNITSAELRRPSSVSQVSGVENGAPNAGAAGSLDSLEGHVPHLIYQRSSAAAVAAGGYRTDTAALLAKLSDPNGRLLWPNSTLSPAPLIGDIRTAQFLNTLEEPDLLAQLPAFVKPLPSKIAPEDVKYLYTKGALTLPPQQLQNALIRAFVEYVHPYMPLVELGAFLNTINSQEGLCGQVSLFLYQALMFSATAFVESKYLREAGYTSRRAARKAFFQKARLLYDFDYESDRLVLVQALLLMTYWYETPDDQKDTWHWMGVAISLAHTIGLHRNPANTVMPIRKQKLWKRIWWSCFMRDRLIALGMRRPTRIQDGDFDVPMLQEGDFEIEALTDQNELLPAECRVVRDLDMQRQLALMCIEKAKLCVCVSHMLKAQYSVLNRDGMRADNTTDSTMMLLPNKTLDNVESVHRVDVELMNWFNNLPQACQYRPVTPYDVQNGKATVAVQRNLLHMVYHTTVSALHRPQFLPPSQPNAPTVSRQIQEMSRMRVRDAAGQITQMAAELNQFHLERYLPTCGVTVILPAMIIHLLEMKSPLPDVRHKATKGFRQCMKVMEKLRDIYAAADFATGFLDAALRKAAIDVNAQAQNAQQQAVLKSLNGAFSTNFPSIHTARSEELSTPPPEDTPYVTATEVVDLYTRNQLAPSNVEANLTITGSHSPPHTETQSEGAEGLTPSTSGSSSEERDAMDVDMVLGQDEFDWNAMAGPNLDFDQWLQFPAEGVNNTDGDFMGMFGTTAPEAAMGAEHTDMDWMGSAKDMNTEATVEA